MNAITTFDHRVFAMLDASPDLHGLLLSGTVIVARWAFLAAPATLALLWLVGGRRHRIAASAAALSAILGLLVAGCVSTLFPTPRPFMDQGAMNWLGHARDGGFPSDHATLVFALGFALILVGTGFARRCGIGLFVLACLVGWSRIFLGAHYPSDVLGAALFGAGAAAIVSTAAGLKAARAMSRWAEGWTAAMARACGKARS